MPRPLGPVLFLLFHILHQTWTILYDLCIDKWCKINSEKGKVKASLFHQENNIDSSSFSCDSSIYLYQTQYLFTTGQQKPQVLYNNRHICSAIRCYSQTLEWSKYLFLVLVQLIFCVIQNHLILFERKNINVNEHLILLDVDIVCWRLEKPLMILNYELYQQTIYICVMKKRFIIHNFLDSRIVVECMLIWALYSHCLVNSWLDTYSVIHQD